MSTTRSLNDIARLRQSCRRVSRTLKALAHPRRLMILGHLLASAKTVNELVELCEASQSQTSQFLMKMKKEGLVRAKRDGRYIRYSVADSRLKHLMKVIQSEYCPYEKE